MTEKEKIRAAKAKYQKQWREENPEKWEQIKKRYWLKKVEEFERADNDRNEREIK